MHLYAFPWCIPFFYLPISWFTLISSCCFTLTCLGSSILSFCPNSNFLKSNYILPLLLTLPHLIFLLAPSYFLALSYISCFAPIFWFTHVILFSVCPCCLFFPHFSFCPYLILSFILPPPTLWFPFCPLSLFLTLFLTLPSFFFPLILFFSLLYVILFLVLPFSVHLSLFLIHHIFCLLFRFQFSISQFASPQFFCLHLEIIFSVHPFIFLHPLSLGSPPYHPVAWGCRMHQLYFCRGCKTSPNKCPRYDTKQYDGEAPVILELWGIWSIPLLPLLSGTLWPEWKHLIEPYL